MTTGNVLYLAMAIGMFVVFALVLGYQSWQQSRSGSEAAPVFPAYRPEPRHGITA